MVYDMKAQHESPRLLRATEVEKMVGFKRQWIHRLIKQDRFPQPIRIGPRAVRWRADEIEVWIDSKLRGHGLESAAARRGRELERAAVAA